MTRPHVAALLILLASCGTVDDRGACDASADCPVGEYCAHTSEGSVCWPDSVAPTVGGVTVACGAGGCVRDGELLVTAEVGDDAEVLAVEATVGFDPTRAFPLARGAGGSWSGTVALAALDFPGFALEAVVTVRALDGARNEVEVAAPEGERPRVGRVRWAYAAGGQLTPAAVAADGTVLFGRSDTDNQLQAVNPDGTEAWSLTVGSGTVTSAPSIGAQAIWVGANDGKLYAVKPDGSGELSPSRTCTAGGVAKGPPAILTTAGVDVAFQAFSSGRIYASGPTCVPTAALSGTDPLTTGTAVDGAGRVFAVTSASLAATLHRVDWDGVTFATTGGWSREVGGEVGAPVAVDGSGSVLTGGKDGGVVVTTVAGTAADLGAEAIGSVDDSPIVLADGSIVVGDAAGRLHRLAADGTALWDPPAELGAAVHAPMALAGGPVRFLVATADGRVHALDEDGAALWSGPLTEGMALGAGNLHTPAGSAFSTAYFGGADGRLHAVVVEGRLDTVAPWPKAWHDARNTSRAGGPF